MTNTPKKFLERDLPTRSGEDRRALMDCDLTTRIINMPAPVGDNDAARKVDVAGAAQTADWNSISGKPSTFAPSAHTHGYAEQICLSSYVSSPDRDDEYNFHGFLRNIVTAGAVSSGSPLDANASLGRIMIVVNAGTDLAGALTVTGTSVNRTTGAETGSDTDVIAVDAVTTDASSTDAQGNQIHSFTGAYVTSKWFKGTVSISTTDLDLSDVDVYMVAYEQFNDEPDVTLNTVDITVENVSPAPPDEWIYAHLYFLNFTGAKANITRIVTMSLDPTPNPGPYRLRRGNIAQAINGTTEGVWLDIFFGPTIVNEWENLNVKIWATIEDTTAQNT